MVKFFLKNFLPIIIISGVILALYIFEGPHSVYRQTVIDITIFSLYWIGLGVASSIGLGTGLHTFVLYLGPYIAQVTLAANECNAVPKLLPSRWRFDHFEACDPNTVASGNQVSFW